MTEPRTYSAKQVATRIGTDAKQLRKFLRDPNTKYKAVGQGARYDFPETDLPAIKAEFDAWSSTKQRRNRSSSTSTMPRAPRLTPKPEAPRERAKTAKALAEAGLTGTALDDDDIRVRATTSIAERAKRHNLTIKGGRWVELPKQRVAVMDDPPHNEEQAAMEFAEAVGELNHFEPDYDPLED
jgi:hypothetical protein